MKREHIGMDNNWPGGVSDGLTLPCVACGQVPKFDYRVSDAVWDELVPSRHKRDVVCLPCLDAWAALRGIDISGGIIDLQFTGAGKTVVFEPTRLVTYDQRSAA